MPLRTFFESEPGAAGDGMFERGEGYTIEPCPRKVPKDLEVGMRIALWRVRRPLLSWFVGTIKELNKRRTVQENVTVAFEDEKYGSTDGHFVAKKDTYGANQKWCLLKPIPIELDDDDEDDDDEDDDDESATSGSPAHDSEEDEKDESSSGDDDRPVGTSKGGGKKRARD